MSPATKHPFSILKPSSCLSYTTVCVMSDEEPVDAHAAANMNFSELRHKAATVHWDIYCIFKEKHQIFTTLLRRNLNQTFACCGFSVEEEKLSNLCTICAAEDTMRWSSIRALSCWRSPDTPNCIRQESNEDVLISAANQLLFSGLLHESCSGERWPELNVWLLQPRTQCRWTRCSLQHAKGNGWERSLNTGELKHILYIHNQ